LTTIEPGTGQAALTLATRVKSVPSTGCAGTTLRERATAGAADARRRSKAP
jgi:hypothetical protein